MITMSNLNSTLNTLFSVIILYEKINIIAKIIAISNNLELRSAMDCINTLISAKFPLDFRNTCLTYNSGSNCKLFFKLNIPMKQMLRRN